MNSFKAGSLRVNERALLIVAMTLDGSPFDKQQVLDAHGRDSVWLDFLQKQTDGGQDRAFWLF